MPHKPKQLPTISLCMIVRDAAANLALCLDSVKAVVDEIIIVDTGSKDNTVALAKKYTDKVYYFKWCDDFSKARNESLKYATKDWVLVLDDDEVLSMDSAKNIKKFLANALKDKNMFNTWVYQCCRTDAEKEIWQRKKYKGFQASTQCKILRNHCGVKFKYFIHEQLEKDGKHTFYQSDLKTLHYGYTETRNDYGRNLRIAKKQLAAYPNDVICQYQYTRSLGNCAEVELFANMDKTIAMYIKGGKNIEWMPLRDIYKSFLDILIERGIYTQIEKYCYEWLTRLKNNYDLWPYLILGKVLFMQNKIDEAYRILKIVYEKYSNKIPFCVKEELGKFEADLYFFFGYACVLNFEYVLGLKLLRIVKKEYFSNAAVDKIIEIAQENSISKNVTKFSSNGTTISLCMIVRDVEKNLALCLNSVKDIVDEIIIVDTGSKDNTVALAKKYTDKVYYFKWCDDFSKARNESLKYATKDWVLVLDDDEVLSIASAKNIKKFLTQADKNVYTILCHNCTRKDAEAAVYKHKQYKLKNMDFRVHTRLFRNHQGLSWKNPIREIVMDKDQYPIQEVQILHYENYRGQDRSTRNLGIVKKWLTQEPENLTAWLGYIDELSYLRKCTDVMLVKNMNKVITKYAANPAANSELGSVYNDFVNKLIARKCYVQAEQYCQDWIAWLQDRYDLFSQLALGRVLFLQKKITEASKILEITYIKHNNGIAFCAPAYMDKFRAELYFYLGAVYVAQHKYKKGLRLLKLVQKNYFNNIELERLIRRANEGFVK